MTKSTARMRRSALLAAGVLLVGASLGAAKEKPMAELKLESPAFADGETIPKKHTCEGEDLSPTLKWSGVPDGTRSFALTVFDPDAPRPQGWVHWAVHGIPAGTGSIPEGVKVPEGATGVTNDFDKTAYGGPCPPPGHGPHRYRFTLYALDVAKLEPAPTSYRELVSAAEEHALAQAQITGLYERKK